MRPTADKPNTLNTLAKLGKSGKRAKMRIDRGTAWRSANQNPLMPAADRPRADRDLFASAAANRSAAQKSVEPASTDSSTTGSPSVDFTSMTRQELFDWMNGEIRSGRISLDESTPFLGMTVKLSAATGQSVDMATDTERHNFVDRMQQGIAGAHWRHDSREAERLEGALAWMLGSAGAPEPLDVVV
jgi:hypothetical protein